MWKIAHASCPGTSHQKSGQPCQDFGLASIEPTEAGPILVAVCADGAGSARFSDVGARLACEGMVRLISDALENSLSAQQIDKEQMVSWCQVLRANLEAEAERREVAIRELACTLLVAVVTEKEAAFAQIGDGAIVALMDDAYRAVFWPQSGEYVNTTNFLTDAGWEQRLEVCQLDKPIHELALFTDGLQPLVLDYAEKLAYARFFGPLFTRLRDTPATDELLAQLRRFLDSPRVNERTDDDKTLIIATRRAADGAP